MVCSWNKLVGVILILKKMTSLIQCACDYRVPYFPVYYPELGKSFHVDVFASEERYIWRKEGKPLTLEICDGPNDFNCTRAHSIFSHRGRADLRFKKITLEDSGKYTLELFYSDGNKRVNSFEIIVQDKPLVLIDCNDMTVYEGNNVICVCKTTIQYPTASVRWRQTKPEQGNVAGMKIFSDILTLKNISKNESGTYTCFVNSRMRNLLNKTSFNLKVMPKNSTTTSKRLKIKYFKVFKEFGVNYSKVFVLCKAEGFPEPNYTISHNGAAVKFGSMYTVDTTNNSSLGQYECLASNRVSSEKCSLFLNASFLVGSKNFETKILCKESNDIEWKIMSIVGTCSFLTGILFVCIVICFCKKCRTKVDQHDNSEYFDELPVGSANEGLGHNEIGLDPEYVDIETESHQRQSANERLEPNEMGLHHTSRRPENEEIRDSEVYVNVGPVNGENTVHYVTYDESNYQDLNELRDKDEDRYQSLTELNL